MSDIKKVYEIEQVQGNSDSKVVVWTEGETFRVHSLYGTMPYWQDIFWLFCQEYLDDGYVKTPVRINPYRIITNHVFRGLGTCNTYWVETPDRVTGLPVKRHVVHFSQHGKANNNVKAWSTDLADVFVYTGLLQFCRIEGDQRLYIVTEKGRNAEAPVNILDYEEIDMDAIHWISPNDAPEPAISLAGWESSGNGFSVDDGNEDNGIGSATPWYPQDEYPEWYEDPEA